MPPSKHRKISKWV